MPKNKTIKDLIKTSGNYNRYLNEYSEYENILKRFNIQHVLSCIIIILLLIICAILIAVFIAAYWEEGVIYTNIQDIIRNEKKNIMKSGECALGEICNKISDFTEYTLGAPVDCYSTGGIINECFSEFISTTITTTPIIE